MTHLEISKVRRKRVAVSQSDLWATVHYDPLSGHFTHLLNRGSRARAGSQAGHLDKRSGYCRLKIDGVAYEAHRLAWLYMTGNWPYMVDHISGDRSDNRWCNLREVDAYQNMMNRKVSKNNIVGVKGVSPTLSGRYVACIRVRKKPIHLGTFDTVEEASKAYQDAAKKYFGEYAYGAV